jgi:hypothetical protein
MSIADRSVPASRGSVRRPSTHTSRRAWRPCDGSCRGPLPIRVRLVVLQLSYPLGGQHLQCLHRCNQARAPSFQPAHSFDLACGLPVRQGVLLGDAERLDSGAFIDGRSELAIPTPAGTPRMLLTSHMGLAVVVMVSLPASSRQAWIPARAPSDTSHPGWSRSRGIRSARAV